MELFPFIDAMFNDQKYAGIPDSVKKKHFFMVQRFMSIKFPMEANKFNVIGINYVMAIDFWQTLLSRRYNKKPSWMFTKSNKTKTASHKIDKIPSKLVDFYLKGKKMDRRDFNLLRELYPDEFLDELKRIEKTVKENNIKI